VISKVIVKILKTSATFLILTAIIALNLHDFFIVSALNLNIDTKEVELGEIVSKRGKYEKHFQNDDGTITVASYNDAIHYKNEKGEWIDIDNTLLEKTDSKVSSINRSINENKITKTYSNKDNPFKVNFNSKANSDELVTVKFDDYSITWGLQNAEEVDSTIKNSVEEAKVFTTVELNKYSSEIFYENALSNSNLRYTLLFSSLKEEIILNENPSFEDIRYNVLSENLVAILQENKDVIFYDVDDATKEVFRVSAPFMYDSAESIEYNENIEVVLEETENGYVMVSG